MGRDTNTGPLVATKVGRVGGGGWRVRVVEGEGRVEGGGWRVEGGG